MSQTNEITLTDFKQKMEQSYIKYAQMAGDSEKPGIIRNIAIGEMRRIKQIFKKRNWDIEPLCEYDPTGIKI